MEITVKIKLDLEAFEAEHGYGHTEAEAKAMVLDALQEAFWDWRKLDAMKITID